MLLKNESLCAITPDRWKGFSLRVWITKELEQVQFYFPYPQHPLDRETNENTNGLLKEYFLKGKGITDISEEVYQRKSRWTEQTFQKMFRI